MSRRFWTDHDIVTETLTVATRIGGFMPSSDDFRRAGKSSLACRIAARGGFEFWAWRLGLPQRDSESQRGLAIEREVAAWLESRGYSVATQTRRAPFDLLLDGATRINVKSGRFGEFMSPRGVVCRGHFFGLAHTWKSCDFFILCPVDAENRVLSRYVVPSSAAKVQTITLTPSGKYAAYLEALHLLPSPSPSASAGRHTESTSEATA